MELEHWRREMRRRPAAANPAEGLGGVRGPLGNRKKNRGTRHGYRTRAARGEDREDDEFEVIIVLVGLRRTVFTHFFG